VRRALFFLAHVAESVTSSAALASNAYVYASDSSSNQSTATFLRPLLSLFVAVVGTRARDDTLRHWAWSRAPLASFKRGALSNARHDALSGQVQRRSGEKHQWGGRDPPPRGRDLGARQCWQRVAAFGDLTDEIRRISGASRRISSGTSDYTSTIRIRSAVSGLAACRANHGERAGDQDHVSEVRRLAQMGDRSVINT
jgi:hypothetical protein